MNWNFWYGLEIKPKTFLGRVMDISQSTTLMTVFAAKSAFFKVRTDEGTCQSDLSLCLVAATCSGCSTHGVTSPLVFSINI